MYLTGLTDFLIEIEIPECCMNHYRYLAVQSVN